MKQMKNVVAILLAAGISLTAFSALATQQAAVKIYVAENGTDEGNGTAQIPFKTVQRAQQAVREKTAAGLAGNIEVIIGEGTYEIGETLEFTAADGGTDDFSVTYRGETGKYPILSGGRKITGFSEGEDGIWTASVPQLKTIREMTVNNVRAHPASGTEIYPIAFWDDPDTAYIYDGYYFDKSALPLSDSGDIELRWSVGWRAHVQVIEEVVKDPANPERVIAKGKQPFFQQSISYHDSSTYYLCRPGTRCRAGNMLEFLDEPGEFYFDKATKTLYYMPREGEDMTSAEVYASVLEKVANVRGRDDAMVNNLHFEGLRFAHTSFVWVDKAGGYSNQQANEMMVANSRDTQEDSATLDISWAKNISIEDCIFFCTGATGARFRHTVQNSKINGCVFYDIGGSGISVGSTFHSSNPPDSAPQKPTRTDMYNYSKWDVSGLGLYGEAPVYANRGVNGVHPTFDGKTRGWFTLTFDAPVSIEEIYYGYYYGEAESPLRYNFEIILANKEDFSDGVTVHRQGNTAPAGAGITIIPQDTTTKYKYLKVRPTGINDFGFTTLNVWTRDFDEQIKDVPRNIDITNNYLARTGNYLTGAPAISAYYYHGLNISNNSIDTVPYSGISSGWGWSQSDAQPLTGLKIEANRISNYLCETQDGGGIYTLSRHRGAEIKYNYLSSAHGLYAAIYNDNGSGGFTIDGNVCENGGEIVFFHSGDIYGNTVTNTYTTNNIFKNVSDNEVTEFKNYIKGNPTPRIRELMNRSGPKKEYRYLRELIPENKPDFGNMTKDDFGGFIDYKTNGETGTARMRVMKNQAETMLGLAICGDLPGQYSAEKKIALRKALDEAEDTAPTAEEHIADILRLENAMSDLENSLVKLPLPEMQPMVEVADKIMAENPDVNPMYLPVFTEHGRQAADRDYAMYKKLEGKVMQYEKTLGKTEVLGFGISGKCLKTDIDKENKQIIVWVPEAATVSGVKPYIELSQGATCNLPESVDLSSPVTTQVTNGLNKSVWTVSAQVASSSDMTDASLWINSTGKSVKKQTDGSILLEKMVQPYIFAGSKMNSFEFDISADTLDDFVGVRMLFGADTNDFSYNAAEDCYFELVLKKSTLELYRVEGKSRSQIRKVNRNTTDLDVNIKVKYSLSGNNLNMYVYEDGKTKIQTICGKGSLSGSPGYIGIFSENSDVRLIV